MSGPIARDDLLDVTLAGTRGIARAHISRVTLGPGQCSGVHRHPCDVVGHVVSGTVRFAVADGPERRLAPGDGFHEPCGATIAHFDNASTDEPAVFIACYLLPPGEERLIEML